MQKDNMITWTRFDKGDDFWITFVVDFWNDVSM